MNKFSFLNITIDFFKKHTVQCVLLFITFFLLGSVFINLPITKIHQLMPFHIDAHLISWIWSWDIHALTTNPLNLFQANIFAPFNNTLAFSETMLGTALLAWPILLIFNNIVLTYNTVALLSFAISGLGMYLLVYYLTKNKLAALLSALIYAFAPFKLIHNGHLPLTGMWLPYVFLYLHKFFKYQTWKNTLLLTLFIILVFLTGFHYFIFLPIVVLFFFLTHFLTKNFKFNKENLKKIILTLIILLIIIIPLILPYLEVKQDYNFVRSTAEINAYSPSIVDYFTYSFFYSFLKTIEVFISPGIIIFLLFIFGLYIIIKNKDYFKQLKIKRNFIIYSVIAITAFLISFGFYIRLTSDSLFKIPGLYYLFYHFVPGFSGIRSPGRYSIFVLLSISVFIGYTFSLWLKLIKDIAKRILLFFIIITFLFIELSFVPSVSFYLIKQNINKQKLYDWVNLQPDNKIFLELPMGAENDARMTSYDINYVFSSRLHFKKIVNGYSGYYPPGYLELADELKTFEPDQDIEAIKKFKTNYLIFHFDLYDNTEELILDISQKVKNSDNIKYITNFGNNYVYEIKY